MILDITLSETKLAYVKVKLPDDTDPELWAERVTKEELCALGDEAGWETEGIGIDYIEQG